MKYLTGFLVLSVTCSMSAAFMSPKDITKALLPLQRDELNLFANSKALIEELVQNLRIAAGDASDAIKIFSTGVQEEVKDIKTVITKDINILKERVSQALETVTNRLLDSGVAVTECIAERNEDASFIFNETFSKTTKCVDDRIAEVTDQIGTFKKLVNGAIEFSNRALDDMRNCTDGDETFLSIGSCLGSVAFQTDMKAVVFATQSGLLIARMNLFLATLPASLQVCAATRLVEAGLHSAKIVMDIGTCSANSVFSIMTGNIQLLKKYS